MVGNALRAGTLLKAALCEMCKKDKRLEAHHHNGYDKAHWYDVMWLCKFCHMEAHANG